jgi:hypothetical protein
MLLNLLRRHLFMGLTASALSSSAPAAKGAIRYRQLWVSADGVTHIDEQECGKLETKDFTSTGGDAALPGLGVLSTPTPATRRVPHTGNTCAPSPIPTTSH